MFAKRCARRLSAAAAQLFADVAEDDGEDAAAAAAERGAAAAEPGGASAGDARATLGLGAGDQEGVVRAGGGAAGGGGRPPGGGGGAGAGGPGAEIYADFARRGELLEQATDRADALVAATQQYRELARGVAKKSGKR